MNLRSLTPLLNVEDTPRAIAFYRDLLGFEVEMAWPEEGPSEWAMLVRDDMRLMINSPDDGQDARWGSQARRNRPSYADALLYFGTPDVAAVHARLSAAGVPVDPITEQMYGRELRLRDPDGYELAFVENHPPE